VTTTRNRAIEDALRLARSWVATDPSVTADPMKVLRVVDAALALPEEDGWRPTGEGMSHLPMQPAWFNCEDDEYAGLLYYFAPSRRTPGPYTTQREVRAIIDIASDGTLGGVELIDNMPPPARPTPPKEG
jgi:hypothetical protein